jgi:hypothetical protein
MFNTDQIKRLVDAAKRHGITPANCPHCEYDRRFPQTAGGGWIYPGNNGPIVPCPMCNADEAHPRS